MKNSVKNIVAAILLIGGFSSAWESSAITQATPDNPRFVTLEIIQKKLVNAYGADETINPKYLGEYAKLS